MAMAKFYQYFNRTLVASDDRMDDRAFAFGDGFFSTIGVRQGQILFLLNCITSESRMA